MKNKSASGQSIKVATQSPNPENRNPSKTWPAKSAVNDSRSAAIGKPPLLEGTPESSRVPNPKPGVGRHH